MSSTLDPRGPAAADIATLWWVMLALGTVIFVIVSGYLLFAAIRQPSERGPAALTGAGTPFLALWGIAVPAVILTGLAVANAVVGGRVQTAPTDPVLTVEVVGHKFWWEVRYPEHDILTANELIIPAGAPVQLHVTAGDVIHAFWVPSLHGKIDMVPGAVNDFWIQADEPGEYRGICAEYCGIQHARMHFVVVAVERGEFDEWLATRTATRGATADRGADVFVSANCVACHTVEGMSPYTDAGPALTDFGQRRTIAAGMFENTRENLADWILNPQLLKRGARMPPTPLPEDDLEALLDYLQGLGGQPQERP